MKLPSIPAALLSVDSLVLNRPTAATDTDGNNETAFTLVSTVTGGLYASPSSADLEVAATRGTKIDAIVALLPGADVQAGDQMVIRGAAFDVVAIEDSRNRIRVHIRKVTS